MGDARHIARQGIHRLCIVVMWFICFQLKWCCIVNGIFMSFIVSWFCDHEIHGLVLIAAGTMTSWSIGFALERFTGISDD